MKPIVVRTYTDCMLVNCAFVWICVFVSKLKTETLSDIKVLDSICPGDFLLQNRTRKAKITTKEALSLTLAKNFA